MPARRSAGESSVRYETKCIYRRNGPTHLCSKHIGSPKSMTATSHSCGARLILMPSAHSYKSTCAGHRAKRTSTSSLSWSSNAKQIACGECKRRLIRLVLREAESLHRHEAMRLSQHACSVLSKTFGMRNALTSRSRRISALDLGLSPVRSVGALGRGTQATTTHMNRHPCGIDVLPAARAGRHHRCTFPCKAAM